MTRAVLLRKMNPRRGPGTATSGKRNAWLSGPSDGESAQFPGETEEKTYDEVEKGGGTGIGRGAGGAAGAGARGGEEEGAAKAGTEPVAGGARKVERHRAKIDHHLGGFARGQVRLQAKSRFEDVCRAVAACISVHVLLYGRGAGTESAVWR